MMTTPTRQRRGLMTAEQIGRFLYRKVPAHLLVKVMVVLYCIWALQNAPYSSPFDLYSGVDEGGNAKPSLLRASPPTVVNIAPGLEILIPSLPSTWPLEAACKGDNALRVESPKLVKSREHMEQEHYANRNYTQQYEAAGYYNASQLQELIRKLQTIQKDTNARVSSSPSPLLVPCRFHHKVTVKLQHFAHAMEKLYMCIDLWIAVKQQHAPNVTAIPILLFDKESQAAPWQQGLANTEFLQGIVQVLESQLGLQQETIQEFEQTFASGLNDTSFTLPSFVHVENGYLLQHVHEWNQMVQQRFPPPVAITTSSSTSSNSNNKNNTDQHCRFRPPRIKILSRRTTRSIANAQAIAGRLSKLEYRYYHQAGQNATIPAVSQRLPPVNVYFFEGTTFEQQLRFFQSTDILISGHGAQLTGLPFMATEQHKCKQVLELYPQHYALPYYFGSLAHQSGIAHSYMYLSNNESDTIVLPWEIRNGATYQERFQARKVKMCPGPDAMVDAVVELVRDWHACHCGASR